MSDASPWATPSHPGVYDTIGTRYALHRRPDARIAAQIERALGDARRICNVGAGLGAYEPADRNVIALDPSLTMLGKRDPALAPRVRGVAEALPFADDAFDAVLAILTLHHWLDRERGCAELERIAPRRVVFHFDLARHYDYWLVNDYLPEIRTLKASTPTSQEVATALGADRIEVIPVPENCTDGFMCAYWKRPEAYLDPDVRACISAIAQLEPAIVDRGMRALEADLASGAWHDRHGDLLDLDTMDWGYRLIVAE